MSNTSYAAFIAGYVVIGLLLLNVLFCTRWMWWVKLASVVAVVGLSVATWQALPNLLGWPSTRGLPERFNLTAMHLVEPDKSGASKGAIYLWVTAFNIDGSLRVPRAFVLPFHPELQAKLVVAGTKLRRGMPQLGEISSLPFETGPAAGAHTEQFVNLELLDTPDPLFPEH